MCATASYAQTKMEAHRCKMGGHQHQQRVCRNEVITNGVNQNMQMKKFDFQKNDNDGSVSGHVFLKTAANGHLKLTHSYSRFSSGTHRDYSQVHRISGSGFSRFSLYIFANLYCLYLENKTLFRKLGSVTLHHLSPSNFLQKREKSQQPFLRYG